jgi:hypothetical protein
VAPAPQGASTRWYRETRQVDGCGTRRKDSPGDFAFPSRASVRPVNGRNPRCGRHRLHFFGSDASPAATRRSAARCPTAPTSSARNGDDGRAADPACRDSLPPVNSTVWIIDRYSTQSQRFAVRALTVPHHGTRERFGTEMLLESLHGCIGTTRGDSLGVVGPQSVSPLIRLGARRPAGSDQGGTRCVQRSTVVRSPASSPRMTKLVHIDGRGRWRKLELSATDTKCKD